MTDTQICDHPDCTVTIGDGGHRRAGTPHVFCSTECNLSFWNNQEDTLQGPEATPEETAAHAHRLAETFSEINSDSDSPHSEG